MLSFFFTKDATFRHQVCPSDDCYITNQPPKSWLKTIIYFAQNFLFYQGSAWTDHYFMNLFVVEHD